TPLLSGKSERPGDTKHRTSFGRGAARPYTQAGAPRQLRRLDDIATRARTEGVETMRRRMLSAAYPAAAPLVAAAAALAPQCALAQEASAPEQQPIVVTGSLIPGEGEDGIAPVDVIGADELAAQGSPTLLDLTKRI